MYEFRSRWVILPEDEQTAIANYCPAEIRLNAREVVGFADANYNGAKKPNVVLPNGADPKVGCTDIQLETLPDGTRWIGLHDICEGVAVQLYNSVPGDTIAEKNANFTNLPNFAVHYLNSDCNRYLVLHKNSNRIYLGLYDTKTPGNSWFEATYNPINNTALQAWLVYDNKIRVVGKNDTYATSYLDGDAVNYHIGMVYPSDRFSSVKGKYVYFQQPNKNMTSNPAYSNFQIPDSALVKGDGGGGGGAGGPTSGPGGGGGNFDNKSDTISAPSGNIKGLVGSGMMGIFSPSEAQLKEFAGFLWSNNIFDQLKKYNDPLDMIISLTQIPTSPPISGNGVVKIGNVLLSETFTLPYVSNQFFEFDMGEITIPEYWGNFLDYSPYTNIQIYLPYIGFREISTDDVMGGTIKLKYVIDCISGTCLGILEVVKKDFDAVLYQWTGNCSMEIPLTGRRTKVDFSSLFSILGTAAGGAAIGGAAGAAVSSGLGAVNAISQSAAKPIISRSGNISSNGGFAGVQTPYIVVSRKIQSLPDKYQVFDGYPANISAKLSSLKGYVKVSKIHLDGISCTESELDEINEYLMGGVII